MGLSVCLLADHSSLQIFGLSSPVHCFISTTCSVSDEFFPLLVGLFSFLFPLFLNCMYLVSSAGISFQGLSCPPIPVLKRVQSVRNVETVGIVCIVHSADSVGSTGCVECVGSVASVGSVLTDSFARYNLHLVSFRSSVSCSICYLSDGRPYLLEPHPEGCC